MAEKVELPSREDALRIRAEKQQKDCERWDIDVLHGLAIALSRGDETFELSGEQPPYWDINAFNRTLKGDFEIVMLVDPQRHTAYGINIRDEE